MEEAYVLLFRTLILCTCICICLRVCAGVRMRPEVSPSHETRNWRGSPHPSHGGWQPFTVACHRHARHTHTTDY